MKSKKKPLPCSLETAANATRHLTERPELWGALLEECTGSGNPQLSSSVVCALQSGEKPTVTGVEARLEILEMLLQTQAHEIGVVFRKNTITAQAAEHISEFVAHRTRLVQLAQRELHAHLKPWMPASADAKPRS